MSEKVIELLNKARARELTAIMSYMGQHYDLENADFGKLGSELKAIAIVEMKHAESLAERILQLDGVPVTKPDADIKRGLEIPALLDADLQLEDEAVKMYSEAAKTCMNEGDPLSAELFEGLVGDEQEHYDKFKNTKDHLDKLGDTYLVTLIGG